MLCRDATAGPYVAKSSFGGARVRQNTENFQMGRKTPAALSTNSATITAIFASQAAF